MDLVTFAKVKKEWGDCDIYLTIIEDIPNEWVHLMIYNTMYTAFRYLHLELNYDYGYERMTFSFYSDSKDLTEENVVSLVNSIHDFLKD